MENNEIPRCPYCGYEQQGMVLVKSEEVDKLYQEVDRLQGIESLYDEAREQLELALSDYRKDTSRLQNALDEANADRRKKADDIDDLVKENASLSDELATSNTEYWRVKKENASLRQQLQEAGEALTQRVQANVLGWTLVEDRLPEKSGHYITQVLSGAVWVRYYYADEKKFAYLGRTIAWMPLPEALPQSPKTEPQQ